MSLTDLLLSRRSGPAARLLQADGPLLRNSLDPKVRKGCERRLQLCG